MAEVNDELLDHDYDGIKEYDNPLPPWWVNLFYITIVWAGAYLLFYHVLEIGDRPIDEYRREYDASWNKEKDPTYKLVTWIEGYRPPYSARPTDVSQKMIMAFVPKAEAPVEEVAKNYKALSDGSSLLRGKDIYKQNCVPCHGMGGEGGIGPNLTDDYWIHGAGVNNLMQTVLKGVPEKGMVTWKPILGEKNILLVVSYVMTLHGTNPPNGKAPQGTLVKE